MCSCREIDHGTSCRTLLKRLASSPAGSSENAQPLTLPQLLIDEQLIKLEDFLSLLVDRSGLPYLPLSTTMWTRCGLPAATELCFENCIVPFDLISRSVLIATANPFDLAVRSQARSCWHTTSSGM